MILWRRSLKSFHLVCFFTMSYRSCLSSYSIFFFINFRLTWLFFAKIDLLNFYMMSFSWLTLGAIRIFDLTKSTVFFCSGMSFSLRLNSLTVSLHSEKVEYYTEFTKGFTSLCPLNVWEAIRGTTFIGTFSESRSASERVCFNFFSVKLFRLKWREIVVAPL